MSGPSHYPIPFAEIGKYCVLGDVMSGAPGISVAEVSPHGVARGMGFLLLDEQSVSQALSLAEQDGALEPLLSLSHFLFPSVGHMGGGVAMEGLLGTYPDAAKARLAHALQHIDFRIKTPDADLEDVILAQGSLLIPAKDHFQCFRYARVERRFSFEEQPYAQFSRMPDLPKDLDTAVRTAYTPRSMESIVLAVAKTPFGISGTVLPAFAYKHIVPDRLA